MSPKRSRGRLGSRGLLGAGTCIVCFDYCSPCIPSFAPGPAPGPASGSTRHLPWDSPTCVETSSSFERETGLRVESFQRHVYIVYIGAMSTAEPTPFCGCSRLHRPKAALFTFKVSSSACQVRYGVFSESNSPHLESKINSKQKINKHL